jgi:cytochrome c oxidase subunit II
MEPASIPSCASAGTIPRGRGARRHHGRPAAAFAAVAFLEGITSARADVPLGYLFGSGAQADSIAPLTWGTLIISVLVVVIVGALLVVALLRRRPIPPQPRMIGPAEGGLSWIYVGVGLTTIVLFGVTVWTVVTLAAVSSPPAGEAGFDLEIVAHQWWWQVHYRSGDDRRLFTTANEIHIPTGVPVRIKLTGVDVIHSFWVPALGGKTDVIPGQTNTTWLEARNPGTYRGQCSEYCGSQHAHMALDVVASAPFEFKSWWDHQLEAPSPATATPAADDENTFVLRCGACHTVRGTGAGGILGPDLSHLMTRATIAAGTLPNRPGYLAGWIADPQHAKPGNLMPQLALSGTDLAAVMRFLETLH